MAHEPASDSDTLKALDSDRPIREADIAKWASADCLVPVSRTIKPLRFLKTFHMAHHGPV